MKKGAVISFYHRKRLALGLLQESGNCETYSLLTEEGKEIGLEAHRVIMPTGKQIDSSLSRDEKKGQLKKVFASIEEESLAVDISGLWEVVQGEGEKFEFPELAEVYLGKEASSEERFLLFWALEHFNPFFKKTGQVYLPRTPDESEGIIRGLQKGLERKEEKEKAIEELRRAWREGKSESPKDELRTYLSLLKNYALLGEEAARAKEAREVLEKIGLKDTTELIALLVQIGEWKREEDFLLERYQVPPPLSPELITATQSAPSLRREKEEGRRVDLTSWETFTIDDESAEVFDDALSLEDQGDRILLGVHIADVAAHISLGSPADQAALERGETFYVPGRRIDMLPRPLIIERLSLSAGQERLTVTLLATFDRTFRLLDYRLLPTLICVKKRLTYEDTRTQFVEEPLLALLHKLTRSLKEKRKEAGAQFLDLPELKVIPGPDEEVTVRKVFSDTPGHLIVSEAMILMNQLVATFFKERDVPALYRSQQPPNRLLDPDGASDPLFPLRAIRSMSPSRISLDPAHHYSLGLAAYSQVTSPIRRYADLILLRQVQGVLREERLPYSREELESIYPALEMAQREARRVERALENYWLLKYLQRYVGKKKVRGIISYVNDRGKASVYLPDYLLEIPLQSRFPSTLEEGMEIEVRLEGIEPLKGQIQAVQG